MIFCYRLGEVLASMSQWFQDRRALLISAEARKKFERERLLNQSRNEAYKLVGDASPREILSAWLCEQERRRKLTPHDPEVHKSNCSLVRQLDSAFFDACGHHQIFLGPDPILRKFVRP